MLERPVRRVGPVTHEYCYGFNVDGRTLLYQNTKDIIIIYIIQKYASSSSQGLQQAVLLFLESQSVLISSPVNTWVPFPTTFKGPDAFGLSRISA